MNVNRNTISYSKDFYEEIKKELDEMEPQICPYCGQIIKKKKKVD